VRILALGALALAATLALAGCTVDPLAEQYADGSGQGYISGDGAVTELPIESRGEPVEFGGPTIEGAELSSAELAGDIVVVNFWYAGCPPCRVEAPALAELSETYADIRFVGVNTIDGADQARTFEQEFGIEYPSILDAQTNSAQLAFASAGAIAPNATPTTLVLDRQGRVAGRISGLIQEASILAAMIDRVLAEDD
jgi:thiol-disulfide isomerase/thioredoxin